MAVLEISISCHSEPLRSKGEESLVRRFRYPLLKMDNLKRASDFLSRFPLYFPLRKPRPGTITLCKFKLREIGIINGESYNE